ncbi:glycosyltransferase family 4 protein [Undibacterium sp. TJN25]|uniref:glycosyltransferase family 4 protein n=1 Tax=Undibacterium sp. TJN25 TaxID=3413056 RepID=UPI003BF043D9
MKILYHHRTRSKDGQSVHIDEMIAAMRDLGHEVIVVAPAGAEQTSFGSDGKFVPWLKRHVPKVGYELMEFAYSLIAYRDLVKAVKLHKPDCLYERYNLFLPAGIWLKRKYNLPMLLEINSPIFEERSRYDGLSLKRLARWSQHFAWNAADFVLPVTQVMAEIVQSYGVPANRMMVIHNGINTREFENVADNNAVKSSLGLNNKLVLGFTGFVRDWHGLDKVIDMIATDPHDSGRHLMVVGDGPARRSLEQQAQALNVGHRVSFTGIVGRDKIPEYVSAFDIALQPAVVAYASPLKLLEYLALGKAIVAPAQPNIQELLQDQHNAVLFDPAEADGLPNAIERLCADAKLRQYVGKNASATISSKQLTWKSNAERVVYLFERLCRHA